MILKLTERECEIMEYLIKGLSPEGIAKKIYMQRSSVYGLIRNIFMKYGLLQTDINYDRKILAINKYKRQKAIMKGKL